MTTMCKVIYCVKCYFCVRDFAQYGDDECAAGTFYESILAFSCEVVHENLSVFVKVTAKESVARFYVDMV